MTTLAEDDLRLLDAAERDLIRIVAGDDGLSGLLTGDRYTDAHEALARPFEAIYIVLEAVCRELVAMRAEVHTSKLVVIDELGARTVIEAGLVRVGLEPGDGCSGSMVQLRACADGAEVSARCGLNGRHGLDGDATRRVTLYAGDAGCVEHGEARLILVAGDVEDGLEVVDGTPA
jgi:hypothetical protein